MAKQYSSEDVEFKPKFLEHFAKLTDIEKFKEYSTKFMRRSIRVNTLKMSVADLKKRINEKGEWKLEPVPWCDSGFYIENIKSGRRDIGNMLEHTLGYVYVQEDVSMIPPLVLKPKPGEIVLDMCAAPGSKTTQMASMMKNEGTLVANDFKGDRIKSLGINLQRCGVSNAIITLMQGHRFAKAGMQFDKILVDAPCSGTGTIRKSLKTLRMWNPEGTKKLAGQQKLLIDAAFQCLKQGGEMVYSTCSVEPEEDEAVVSFLLNKYEKAKTEKIDIPIKHGKPIMEFDGNKYNDSVEKVLRLWPQDNDTEGFFIAKIKKL
ncbi:MAG: NOL1/NOP2/sun family putative RNA methylase [Nanoarchaeota archaeon]|nr:NOL1/NOP2/sun family putative RNA methylase [Nanoarchaeota archaeon]